MSLLCSCDLWHSVACSCIIQSPPLTFPVSRFLSTYKGTRITSAKTLFPNKATFSGTGIRTLSFRGIKVNPFLLHRLHNFTPELEPFAPGNQSSCRPSSGPMWRPNASWHLDTLLNLFPPQSILLPVSVTPTVSVSLLWVKLGCVRIFFSFHPQVLVYLHNILVRIPSGSPS